MTNSTLLQGSLWIDLPLMAYTNRCTWLPLGNPDYALRIYLGTA